MSLTADEGRQGAEITHDEIRAGFPAETQKQSAPMAGPLRFGHPIASGSILDLAKAELDRRQQTNNDHRPDNDHNTGVHTYIQTGGQDIRTCILAKSEDPTSRMFWNLFATAAY